MRRCDYLPLGRPEIQEELSHVFESVYGPFAIGSALYAGARANPFSAVSLDTLQGYVASSECGDFYLPKFCNLIRVLRAELSTGVFATFEEMAFPRFITTRTAEDFGLLNAWPQMLFSVSATDDSQSSRVLDGTSSFFLDPVQCAPIYSFLRNSAIEQNRLPLCIRESMGGWSYRNERADSLRLGEKGSQFLRDEYVFFGSKSDIITIRKRLLSGLCGILKQHDLQYRVVVGAGCFEASIDELEDQLQKPLAVQEIPVLDIELYIPQRQSWLEVAGATLWGSRLTSRFDIRTKDFDIESGCLGVGISRLAYGIILQGGYVQKEKNS